MGFFSFSTLPVLKTQRLILRPLKVGDARAIYEYSNKPGFGQCLKRKKPFTRRDVIKYVSGILNKEPVVYWVMLLKKNNQLIGDCGLCEWNQQAQRAELSYAVSPDAWNQGYATEAALCVMQFGFENTGVNRIQAICNSANSRSERVMQKCGLKPEGVLRQYIQCDGQPLDMKMYSILKQEWAESQKIKNET